MSDLFAMLQAAAGAAGEEQYEISRSLRFNSADSAYLSRTPAGAGNRRTWTWSGWVKPSKIASYKVLFSAGVAPANTDSTILILYLDQSNSTLGLTYATVGVTTSALLRDPAAWYHIVCAVDTTQATEANRIKIYINGVEASFSSATYPSQNTDGAINNNIAHAIGRRAYYNDRYLDGYLTEIHFVDGEALTADDFGKTNVSTGVWTPKAYVGTYGTNGFYLPFSDNTSTTTLGYDEAGSNDWTLNNFSVASGAGNDSVVDTPTPYGDDTGAGGEVRGNYCVLNPLQPGAGTITNGGLTVVTAVSGGFGGVGTMAVPSSGKWYWEGTPTNNGSDSFMGIYRILNSTYAAYYANSGDKYISGTNSAYGATFTNNDVIGVAVDVDAGEITFYKNGSSQGAFSFDTSSGEYVAWFNDGTGARATTYNVNFGQQPFVHAAPSGFKALCTQNLPDSTIADGGDYFNTVLYTGNGSTQSITGVGFRPDFVWIKERSSTSGHRQEDAVRGAGYRITSNETSAENYAADRITSFDSNGFSLGSDTAYNENTQTYVAWNWNAGGANATNTDGVITSTVRANPTAGFSIVSWTANGSNTDGVGHGLGVTPELVIYKRLDDTSNWFVWTTAIDGSNDDLRLNTTDAKADLSGYGSLTSTTISNYGWGNTELIIAYCFAEVEGYSKIGIYTGNGSTDGPFVYCGFRPAFIIFKQSDAVRDWVLHDAVRDPYNVCNKTLYPNLSDVEYTLLDRLDILSNGFKLRATSVATNASSGIYLFMAFAENPFKLSLAR